MVKPPEGTTHMDATIFDRIVCGVDGTDESREAVSQVARLAPGSGRVILCSVWNTSGSIAMGWSPLIAGTAAFPKDEVTAAVDATRGLLPDSLAIETVVVEGPPGPMLLVELARHRATLIALGSHDHRRLMGIVLGSVTTQLLHESPCPVLLARTSREQRFPSGITVAADGSAESVRAVHVAAEIARRLETPLAAVVATGGGATVDLDTVRAALHTAAGPDVVLREDPDSPVDALTRIDTDLLVVGSRGLQGLRSLGSVSERVAHDARCSVLVVR